MSKQLPNPHPGEILQKEFLEPLNLSHNALARAIDVPSNIVRDLVLGRRDITVDIDLRLARYFLLSEGYWLRLQNAYDTLERNRADFAKGLKMAHGGIMAENDEFTTAETFLDRANKRLEDGDIDGAILDYSAAIRKKPDLIPAWNNRGCAWQEKDEHDKAIDDFDEAIRLDPENADAWHMRGHSKYKQGDWVRANPRQVETNR